MGKLIKKPVHLISLLMFIVSIGLTIFYLNIQKDYYELLKQNLDLKESNFRFIKKLKEVEEGIDLIRIRLNRYETIKKGVIGNPENKFDKSSILLSPVLKDHKYIDRVLDDYSDTVEKLTSRLSYLSVKGIFKNIPSIWPTSGWISSTYGWRLHPIYRRRLFHNGIDIANSIRTPVFATASGRVVQIENIGGYGRSVVIDHGNGLETRYSHLSKTLVKEGTYVGKGEKIALMGNSGLSTGPHIHYEVRVGDRPDDPLKFIF